MANFLLLYTGGGMPESEAEQAAVMKAWGAWYEDLGSAVIDGGNPFTSEAKTISPDRSVNNGPVGTMASGYSIIAADSHDAAVELAKGCPMLDGNGQISVYEILPAM